MTLTQLQQGAYYLCLDIRQLAVELPLGRSQLVEAGDEAHNIPVRERHTLTAAGKHIAHITQLEINNSMRTHTHLFLFSSIVLCCCNLLVYYRLLNSQHFLAANLTAEMFFMEEENS